jgi:hypothetical protein
MPTNNAGVMGGPVPSWQSAPKRVGIKAVNINLRSVVGLRMKYDFTDAGLRQRPQDRNCNDVLPLLLAHDESGLMTDSEPVGSN